MNTEELTHTANAASHLRQAAKELEALGDNKTYASLIHSMADRLTALPEQSDASKPTDVSLPLILPGTLSRVELIHHIPGKDGGRRYVTYRAQGGELSFQDGGRTLKFFVTDSGENE